jgi:hypothetical protein
VVPPLLYRPILPLIPSVSYLVTPLREGEQLQQHRKLTNPFRFFLFPDILLLLLYMGVNYAIFYGVVASISSLFIEIYPYLTQTELGLCYLAVGGGIAIGATVCGRLIDVEYRRFRTSWIQRQREEGKSDPSPQLDKKVVDETAFPIERARLRLVPFFLFPFLTCVAVYGWCLQKNVHISLPLVFQFISA